MIGNDTVTVNGNTGWKNANVSIDADPGEAYSLSITSDNYYLESNVTGFIRITKAPIILTIPELTGTYYEDRIEVVHSEIGKGAVAKNAAGTNVAGKFTYSTPTYAGTASTSVVTINVEFKPTDSNYATVNEVVEVTLNAVAFVGDVYYGTVDKAISETTSGTITVIPGTNPIIKTSGLTVASGVTLSVPYALNATNSSTATSTNQELTGTITNQLYINDEVILNVIGSLEIGGILSGGQGGSNYAGHTCDQYSVVYLGTNAQIMSSGNVYCYGYIEEKTHNNGSKITIDSGNIYMPFILRDFKGGSQTYGLYSAFGSYHSAPFNLFEFINVTPKLRINYNGSLVTWANLYAGDQHNPTSVTMIGNAEGAVIRFTDSTYSYVESKYDKTYVNESTGNLNGKINLDIYGGATANSMKLTLKVLGTITVSTNDIYFPISYLYNINLRKAEGQTSVAQFALNQRFKLMTGAVLRVNEGARFTANDLVVYSYYDSSSSIMAGNKYPIKDIPGQFIVNGAFEGVNFAGTILTETNSGATVTVTGNTSITSYEPKTYSGSSITTKIEDWTPISEKFKLHLFEGNGISNNTKTVATGTFYSKNGGWYSTEATIYYEPNGGTLSGSESEGPYQTGANGFLIESINTTNPTRDHYTFDGWYIDPECKNTAIGEVIYVNTYVYAKWIPISYDIYYKNTYYQGSTDANGQKMGTFNYETDVPLSEPTNGKYVFGGWYIDSACENRITNIIGEELVKSLDSENKLNIYALWYPEGTASYTVNYVPNLTNGVDYDYSDLGYYSTYSFTIMNDDWTKVTLQQLSTNDSKYDKPYYFGGWYSSPTFEESTKVTSLNEGVFGELTSITLYAKWVKKVEITIKFGNIEANYYLMPNQEINIPTAQKLGSPYIAVDGSKEVYIILRELVFKNGSIKYKEGDTFTAVTDTLLEGEIVETYYYQMILQAEKATVSVSVSNGGIIMSSEDTAIKTSHSFGNSEAKVVSETIYVSVDSSVSATFSYNASRYKGFGITYSSDGSAVTVEQNENGGTKASTFTTGPYVYTILGSSGNSSAVCVYEDAEVLMADGTTKLAKDVKLGDVVLTWSFAKGKYVATPIIFVERLKNIATVKTTLYFDDGTSVEFAGGQSFFDINKREFISIDYSNVYDYIGVTIMSYNNGKISYKQIIDASEELAFEDTYEFITAYEYSFIYDNVLTMEPFMLYKLPFEINEEFKYDEELMMKDIETYGLYEYEEWSYLVTKEQFDIFNGQYIKVAVGKGYYTEDYIVEIIKKYIVPENLS